MISSYVVRYPVLRTDQDTLHTPGHTHSFIQEGELEQCRLKQLAQLRFDTPAQDLNPGSLTWEIEVLTTKPLCHCCGWCRHDSYTINQMLQYISEYNFCGKNTAPALSPGCRFYCSSYRHYVRPTFLWSSILLVIRMYTIFVALAFKYIIHCTCNNAVTWLSLSG